MWLALPPQKKKNTSCLLNIIHVQKTQYSFNGSVITALLTKIILQGSKYGIHILLVFNNAPGHPPVTETLLKHIKKHLFARR
jgi:hypothetical protein